MTYVHDCTCKQGVYSCFITRLLRDHRQKHPQSSDSLLYICGHIRYQAVFPPPQKNCLGRGSRSHAFSPDELFPYYVIRSKHVGVRAVSLSMFFSEKRLRTDIFKYFPTHNTVRITQPLLYSANLATESLARHSCKERGSG